MTDLAGTLMPIVERAPTTLFKDSLSSQILTGLREYRSNLEAVNCDLAPLAQRIQTTVSSTMSAASIAVSSTDWSESYGFPNIEPLLHLQRQWIMPATVKELLHALGLDVSRGQNSSALALLQDAERALAVTGHDAAYGAGVTIPLREAIHVAVDELLKRRPVTSRIDGGLKGKITALASQCGRPTNTSEAIDRVAESAACLIDELSATKNKNADRGRVRTLFVQGLGVLESVANLIDASKLRSP